jgi:hypothetical protein
MMDAAHWEGVKARQRGTKCRALLQEGDMVPTVREGSRLAGVVRDVAPSGEAKWSVSPAAEDEN